MKQKAIVVIICALVLTISNISRAADNPVLWGVKVTGNVELPGKWRGDNNSVKMFNPGAGFTAGVVSNIYLDSNFYLEPGVSFFYSRYNYDLSLGYFDNLEENPSLSKYGIQVPIVVGYTFHIGDTFSMNLFTGPQVRYALGGGVGIKDEALKEENEDLLSWDTFRRFDCSWKIGLGFPVDNFAISLEADLGMTNLIKPSDLTGRTTMRFRENRLLLGLTYYF
ncbi:MAG: PorT family protein [Muribaculaceae bacterium]|nr:PorT family protein [Muribaculaceae bacterium]